MRNLVWLIFFGGHLWRPSSSIEAFREANLSKAESFFKPREDFISAQVPSFLSNEAVRSAAFEKNDEKILYSILFRFSGS
jgi:hypothetical protein